MEITINLMNVLYVVLAYLAVGYVTMLAINIAFALTQMGNRSDPERKGHIVKALYWSLFFSWAFPYAVFTEVPDMVKSRRLKKMRNGYFVKEDGTPVTYEELYKGYGGFSDNAYEDDQHPRFWAIGKENEIYKYAKQNYATA